MRASHRFARGVMGKMAPSESPCLWGDDGSADDAGKYRKDSPGSCPERATARADTGLEGRRTAPLS